MSDLKTALSSMFDSSKDALKMGVGTAGSAELEEALVDALHDILPFSLPSYLKHPIIRDHLEPLLLSSTLVLACRMWPDKLPKASILERVGYLATVSKFSEVSRPAFKYVRRYAEVFLKKLKERGLESFLESNEVG